MPKLITIEEAAEFLRVNPATVASLCRAGKLPARKVGEQWRIDADSLEGMFRFPQEPANAAVR